MNRPDAVAGRLRWQGRFVLAGAHLDELRTAQEEQVRLGWEPVRRAVTTFGGRGRCVIARAIVPETFAGGVPADGSIGCPRSFVLTQ